MVVDYLVLTESSYYAHFLKDGGYMTWGRRGSLICRKVHLGW